MQHITKIWENYLTLRKEIVYHFPCFSSIVWRSLVLTTSRIYWLVTLLLFYNDRTSSVMLCFWYLQTNKISLMPWMRLKSPTSLACTPCASGTGMYPISLKACAGTNIYYWEEFCVGTDRNNIWYNNFCINWIFKLKHQIFCLECKLWLLDN